RLSPMGYLLKLSAPQGPTVAPAWGHRPGVSPGARNVPAGPGRPNPSMLPWSRGYQYLETNHSMGRVGARGREGSEWGRQSPREACLGLTPPARARSLTCPAAAGPDGQFLIAALGLSEEAVAALRAPLRWLRFLHLKRTAA